MILSQLALCPPCGAAYRPVMVKPFKPWPTCCKGDAFDAFSAVMQHTGQNADATCDMPHSLRCFVNYLRSPRFFNSPSTTCYMYNFPGGLD